MRTGTANLPLHGGKAPAWLFSRMKILAAQISIVIIENFGQEELLTRLSDPYWFQAFGCVLGFDWHSSGLTTTVCGALKEGFKELSEEYGVYFLGGKGKTSRKTPSEIEIVAPKLSLPFEKYVYASKMSAKVDNTAVQDGYQLYHHMFILTKNGSWGVVQQGMNKTNRYARRYHWLDLGDLPSFIEEPHAGIAAAKKEEKVLDLTAKQSGAARETTADIAKDKPGKIIKEIKKLQELSLPYHHEIRSLKPESLNKILLKTYERQPENFESLLSIKGVGPKTIRALSMVSELVYGAKPSWQDPAKYSFAHGGKDGIPYPVDLPTYEKSIEVLKIAIDKAKIGDREKFSALEKLSVFGRP